MSERRKGQSEQTQEPDKQYLDRTGASAQLKDVLTKLIENRPKDPIEFLADYFETLGEKVDRVAKAHQQICLTHHTKPAFDTNVRIAYNIISQTKVAKSSVRGVNGVTYNELLLLMIRSFPATVNEKLLKRMKARDHEVITYDIFRSAIFTCCVLEDFLKQSSELFASIDTQNSGKIDHTVCEAISIQLADSIKSSTNGPNAILEAGFQLGPTKLHEAIAQAILQKGSGSRAVSLPEFQDLMSDALISKVQVLK